VAKSSLKPSVEYSQAIAQEICNAIASSTKGIGRLCRENPHWPDRSNIYKWCFMHSLFRDQYAQAKCLQVDWLVEEALEIAYDGTRDTYVDEKNGQERCDNEWVARSRLKVDTIKWYASKLAPKLYGDKKESDEKDGSDFISKNRDKLNNK
jgi:terminase small subunit-like protein